MAKKQIPIDGFNGNKNKKKNEDPNQEKISKLVEEIQKHRYLYYNKTPEITDAEYDQLEDELRILKPDHPIFQKVGVDSSELFTKRPHVIVMGSQDKVVTEEEFLKWAKKVNHYKYVVQHKLDGISIELQYKNSVFQCAVSRGDSVTGDDYTQNVVNMKGFVSHTKNFFTGAIRAEILLFKDVFNAKYSDNENCRNASAGIVRRKDGKGANDLNIVYYDAYSNAEDSIKFVTEIEKLKWLKENGFNVVKTKIFKNPDEIIDYRNETMDNLRTTLNYDIDGLVVKGNEIDEEVMKRPKPAKQIAFKLVKISKNKKLKINF